MRKCFSSSRISRSVRAAVVAIAAATGAISFASPAEAQLVDLNLDLADLLTRLTSLPSGSTTADRLANLDDVAARLLAPDGLLSDISAQLGSQDHLLDLRASDIASLRVDLSALRSAVDLGSGDKTDLTDLRSTVSTHTTTLADHETRIDSNSRDIATLTERSVNQGADITRLNGRVENHEGRITTLETMVDDGLGTHTAQLSEMGRQMTSGMQEMNTRMDQMNLRVDQLSDRVDTATEGVAMAMALKSPYVPDDKSFAMSGGWGNFEGKNAFGMSGAVRAGRFVQIDAGVAVGADNGTVGGRAGATITW